VVLYPNTHGSLGIKVIFLKQWLLAADTNYYY
jgi:hypothetical protein